MREFIDNIRQQMKPKYHELTTYLTALACAILFFVYPEFRAIYFEILSGAGADRASLAIMALGVIASIGFFLSFLHVFIKRKKSWFEKMCMGAFIMGANGFAGIVAGVEMLPSRSSILVIIPVWNILMGIILLYEMGLSKFDITDENASPLQVLGASITLFVVFGLVDFGFHLTWAMALSICLFYSSTIVFFVTWIINYVRYQRLAKA